MDNLDPYRVEVALPDALASAEATARQLTLTKPAGALGRLEEISIWAAGFKVVAHRSPSPDQVSSFSLVTTG